jgi:hypothetical protein
MKAVKTILLLLLLMPLIAACGSDSVSDEPTNESDPISPEVVPKGTRLLEIHVSEPAGGDFAEAFNLAQSVGMDAASLSLDWNSIDIATDDTTNPPTPIYANDPATDFPAIANICYPNSNTKISMMLRPITTLARMAPPGFENLPFDDPAMITRFNALIDHVLGKIPDLEISALAIGSEVDLYLLDGTSQQQYLSFYEQVSAYSRATYARLYPDKDPLKVAVEVTYKGLINRATRAYYQQLNEFSDVVGVSYYPLESGLVRDPSVVAEDFEEMLALYPGKKLHFFQLGYPSGYYSTEAYAEYAADQVAPSINSSDQLQAQFIGTVFELWDTHADRIQSIGFTWMHDKSVADVAEITANPAFGGLANPPPDYVEFLRTLGLRTEEAIDKPAWARLAQEAEARGWSDTGHRLSCY